MNVRQECGHLALESIRIDPPEFFTRALGPFTVNVRGTEPVGEGLIFLSTFQEGFEIAPCFPVELILGLFNRFGFFYLLYSRNSSGPARYILRKTVEFPSRLGKGIGLSSNAGIPRRAGDQTL